MNIQKFYNSIGWKKNQKVFEDAKLFEDLRKNSKEYVSKCRKRILRYIPKKGKNILDFASGPIQYPEYILFHPPKLKHPNQLNISNHRGKRRQMKKENQVIVSPYSMEIHQNM